MSLGTVSDFFDVADDFGADLLADLQEIIQLGSEEMPRSQQIDLGPSEIGEPCLRKLAYKMMGEPPVLDHTDPLAALFGTGFHYLFSGFVERANARLGRVRWVTEQKVKPRPGGGSAGTMDLFDLDTLTVIDLKCPGSTKFAEYTRHGPPLVYKRQVHIYGLGFWRTFGVMPRRVAIFWVGRASSLAKSKLWIEPFDPTIADSTFERYDNLALALDGLEVEKYPERYALIPIEPSDACRYCEYFSPDPRSPIQCKGDLKDE